MHNLGIGEIIKFSQSINHQIHGLQLIFQHSFMISHKDPNLGIIQHQQHEHQRPTCNFKNLT